ncbi:uncharacterized protein MJAP1_003264 [Malassezia japonica]|uniref:Uncharacterized protein n=1 Tax=Malassezia japonica TaxID=223818 RepID=A0AAF0F031_9BASI|nr:uncharacterized protein MJAP1_003264 [Malassezia japonica]WFD40278.1 hypothetical protein MJAP1_003264 [Malassezia japonica]
MDAEEAPGDSTQLAAIASWLRVLTKRTSQNDEILTSPGALFEVLSALDTQHFRAPKKPTLDVLYKRLVRYYDDVLNVDQELPKVDTKAAGRKPPAEEELAKLMRLVLGAIAKSPDNDAQISAMQSLPYADQMVLMRVIESVLATLQAPQEAEEVEAAPDTSTDMNLRELENMRRELAKKTELVNLHQDQLASAEAQIERLTEENKEMNAVLPGLRDSERERDTFRDQLDEWRPIIEQSKRQEAQIEKYRSRLEETSDLQRELQDLRSSEQDLKTTLAKKYSSDKGKNGSGKSTPKEFRPVLDLLTESFQLDDVVMQRLSECWDRANQLRQDATPTSDAAVQAVQRVYRETSWEQLMTPALPQGEDTPRAPVGNISPSAPSTPSNGTSWLAQQRSALADALRFARK